MLIYLSRDQGDAARAMHQRALIARIPHAAKTAWRFSNRNKKRRERKAISVEIQILENCFKRTCNYVITENKLVDVENSRNTYVKFK